MIVDRSPGSRLFDALNILLMILLAWVCVFPLVHIIAVAFSSRPAVTANLVGFWPIGYTTANFSRMLAQSQFVRSFFVSVLRTLSGSGLSVAVVILSAYPFSRKRGFRGRGILRGLFLFAMLFNGGLIPLYLAMRSLHLLDTFWALILPGMVQIWYIIIMINFFRSLPDELAEAAMMDGASHWRILFNVYLPLALPAIVTIVLFSSVDTWNEWFQALIFLRKQDLWPMQTYLMSLVQGSLFNSLVSSSNARIAAMVSANGLRAAQIVLTTLPILLVYPFIQRYFIHGLTLGSVKG
jgi:putative aldouronate transport system permease protein